MENLTVWRHLLEFIRSSSIKQQQEIKIQTELAVFLEPESSKEEIASNSKDLSESTIKDRIITH